MNIPLAGSADAGQNAVTDVQLRQAQFSAQSGDHAKIQKSAQDFESILLGSWLQGAESSFGSVPGGDPDEGEGGQMMSLGTQQLASAIVHSGGIGIARMIATSLEKSAGHKGMSPDSQKTDAAGKEDGKLEKS